MVQFNEEKQRKNVRDARAREEEDLARILSEKYDLPYLNLAAQAIEPEALRLLGEEETREANAVAFSLSGKDVKVATTTPEDPKTSEVLEELSARGYTPSLFFVSQPSLDYAWKQYKELSFSTETHEGLLEISSENVSRYTEAVSTLEEGRQVIEEEFQKKTSQRVTRIIEAILASAFALRASDVHVEPEDGQARLRLRIDGMLSDVFTFDLKTYELLLSRVKLLSGLKLNVRDSGQDGRFTISLGSKEVEIRVSMLPGGYGESIVLRILDPDTLTISLEELGMHPTVLEVVRREISRPNGMVLNTGPTGSGKTTTLYAFLLHLKNPEIKVVTIEDPIEYHLQGIVQTQASEKGLTFAEGLRSMVRQDPDVIMVGEIRDEETASIAVRSAMTGHLVFSTLHTNTAAGTLPRLIDLDVDPKVLGPALNATMSQRLVRRLCEHCKTATSLSSQERELAERIVSSFPEGVEKPQTEQKYEAVGCDKCNGRGYVGRIGIFEIIVVAEELEKLLHEKGNPSEQEILAISEKQGILNMKQDAVLKILSGITTFKETRRVIEL